MLAAIFALVLSPTRMAACSQSEPLTPFTGGIREYEPVRPDEILAVQGARAGIASHHGLASRQIARFYESLRASAGPGIRSVIIIGPDHFHAGLKDVSVCSAGWQTEGVTLPADEKALAMLTDTGAAEAETLPFRMEHSIGLHIDFVSRYFPGATVTALIIKKSAALQDIAKLVPVLTQMLDERTLLILSMDFSHEKTPAQARIEDDKSVQTIMNFNANKLQNLDIDAPKAAWLFLKTLAARGLTHPSLLCRTNSSEIAGQPDMPCTSYAFMLFAPQK
jgi:AmmeMemoRadiSam system protein B